MIDKIISICYTANGQSEKAYSYSKAPSVITGDNTEIHAMFNRVRKYIKDDFNTFLSNNYACTNEYRFEFIISIAKIKEDKVYFKRFTIDPKKMKI